MRKKIKKSKSPNYFYARENNLFGQIKELSEGLYYISETDAEILPFAGKKAEAVNKEEILRQIEKENKTSVEEIDFEEFFAPLTEIHDWFGDEEKESAGKFGRLKSFLEKNLKDLRVFKIGTIELEIYLVGLDAENTLTGVKTKAVET